MSIILGKNKNLIQFKYTYKTNNKELIFLANNLNIIFYNENKQIFNNLSLNDLSNKDEIIECIERATYIFFFSYNYLGNSNLIEYLCNDFEFNLLKFCYLNIFWYGFIVNDIIRNEEVYKDIENKELNLFDNINKNYDIESEFECIEIKLNNFINSIKTITINELIDGKNQLFNKYKNLNLKIDNVNNMYQEIDNVIQNSNVGNDNSNVGNDNSNVGNEKKYLSEIISNIKENENKQKLKIEELNNIIIYIENKKNILNNIKKTKEQLEFKIENLKYELNDLENEKNKKRIKNSNYFNNSKEILTNNFYNKKNLKDIGVFIHIYNVEIFDNIYLYVLNLYNLGIKFDLYINLAVNNSKILINDKYTVLLQKLEDIKNKKICDNLYLTYSDNKGMDIGGFFTSYIKIIDNKINYRYILKLHTKVNNNWRFAMLYSLLGNKSIINNNLNLLKKKEIGMIGNDTIDLNNIINKNSYRFIHTYISKFNVKYRGRGNFIPGTCFWIKGEILDYYFTKSKLQSCYEEFQQDYCGSKINNREGKPHAFERFFGLMVENFNMKTVRFDTVINN